MASYENTLRQLQNEVDKLKRENKRQLKEIQKAYEKELDRLQKQMLKSQNQELKRLERQYQSMLDEYKRNMRGEITELNRQYRQIIDENNREIRRYKKLIEDLKKQVEEEIQKIQRDLKDKDKKKKNLALKQLNEFKAKIDEIKQLPHQKFKPDKLKIIEDLTHQINNLLSQEFYEAAIAVAENGILRLEIFEYEVNSDIEAWKYAYEQLDASTKRLKELADNYESNWNSSRDKFKDINYWSFGKYGEMKDRLNHELEFINKVDDHDVNQYLMNTESLSIDQVNALNQDALNDLLEFIHLTSKTTDNLNKYNQRELIIKDICDDLKNSYLYRKGKTTYEVIEYPASESRDYLEYMQFIGNNDNQSIDYRGWIKKAMQDRNKNQVILYIVPEDMGSRYVNRIILHVKSRGVIPNQYLIDIIDIIQRNHLNKLEQSHKIEDFELQLVQVPDDTADLLASRDQRISNFVMTLNSLYLGGK